MSHKLTVPIRRAFTLIELLIVVAIMAIMSAASLVVFIGPMQEQAFASIDHGRQAGESALFARLVEDAHSATRVVSSGPGTFVLEKSGVKPQTITYRIDEQKQLRRQVVTAPNVEPGSSSAGAALLENVETFSVEPLSPEAKQYRVRLASNTTRYARRLGDEHELIIGIGASSWAGETR